MEYNNSEKIRQHLPKLIEITKCSNVFLAYFTSEDIFCKSDDEKIKLEQRNFGDTAAASKFYDLIVTKRGSFEILLHALRETKQSGALSVLVDVNEAGNKGLENSALKFAKSPAYMEEFAKDDDKILLIISSEDCEITCEWILETTRNCKLFRAGNINELESLGKDYVAVVNVGKNLDTLHFLAKNYEKKTVLVTSISLDDESLLTLNTSTNKCMFVQDNIHWKDLALAEKEKILTGLKESLKIDGKHLTDVLETVETKRIASLIRGSFPLPHELFSETIPNRISYYIPRTLVTRNVISKEIFLRSSVSGENKDLFLFTNIERHLLSKFAKDKLTDTSENLVQSKNPHTPFVIMDNDNHYHDICKIFSESFIHHLRYDQTLDNFVWLKSNGNIFQLHKCISTKQCSIDESDFLEMILTQQQGSPICISDTPGMGKSILLSHLAAKLKKVHNNGMVAFALISELVSTIKKKKSNGSSLSAAIISAIFDHVSISKLGHAYLQVKKTFIRELFLDGLDEIDPDEMEFALDCIKEIGSIFKDTRIWITTRPHVLHTLESELNTLGYNIAPFTNQNQISFLTSFWSSRIMGEHESQRITDFAKQCLCSIKSSLDLGERANNPSESTVLVDDIAGVPLQCLLVGEVYEDDANFFIQSNVQEIPASKHDIRSIPDLYSKMIDKKFTNFKNRYDKCNLSLSEINIAHMRMSVQQLFPTYFSKSRECLTHTLSMQQILDVGIIEAQNVLSTPRFIHRTFAEYFMAYFIVNVLFKSRNKEAIEFLTTNILKTTNHPFQIQEFEFTSSSFDQIVIVRFVNAFLEKLEDSQHPLLNYFEDFEDLLNVLTASLRHNFENLFNSFLQYARSISKFDENFFTNETFVEAVYWANIPLLKTVAREYISTKSAPVDEIKVLNHVYGDEWYYLGITACDSEEYYSSTESISDKDDTPTDAEEVHSDEFDNDTMANQSNEPGLTLLHIAVHRGDFSTVEFLLTNYFLDSVQENIAGKYDTILHTCVENSMSNSDRKIEEQIQIINILGNTNPSLLITANMESAYPIECKEVHIKLLHEMWKTTGVLYHKSVILRRILFRLLHSLDWESIDFIKTVVKDIEPALFNTICTGNVWHNSFLKQIIIANKAYIELLEFLKICSASFCLAEDKVSVFKLAVDNYDGFDSAKWLIQNVKYTTDEIRDLLWYSIKKECSLCVDIVLENLKINLLSYDIQFQKVFDLIFEDVIVVSCMKNIKLAMKLLAYIVTKMFLSKPVNEDDVVHIGTKTYMFLERDPLDLDKCIKYGIILLTLLEGRKRLNCVECYFLKCMWISDKVKHPTKNFTDKCKNYLGLPNLEAKINGSTLLNLAAKHFCDEKISETFLSIIKMHGTNLKDELFFSLVSYISEHKKLNFWMTLIDVYGTDLGINRYIEHIPLVFLTSYERTSTSVMAVLNSQLNSLHQGTPTILNIQRIVYILIKNHDLDLIQDICAWCIRSCPSKTMAFSDIKIFFNCTAYTLLDAAIESLNGDVLQYVYTFVQCKNTFMAKTKVPSFISCCLSNIETEVDSKIRYVKMLAKIFPNNIKQFLNQPNDIGLVPLSLPSLDEELVGILVHFGANVNFQDEKKNTPLHCALLCDRYTCVVRELVKHGANVNLENNNGETPLLAVVKHQNITTFSEIDFIMINNFNLTKTYSDGNTIVHLIGTKISTDIEFQNLVECLISKKYLYLLNVRNSSSKTPLQLVEENINLSLDIKNTLKLHRIIV